MKNTFLLIATLTTLSTPLLAQDCGELCENSFWISATPATLTTALTAADPNLADTFGTSPMHKAVSFSTVQMVEILLDAGADVSQPDNYGGQPIHYLMTASADRVATTLPLLLARGADINAADNDGRTPFMLASRQPVEIIQSLIDSGANLNAQDNAGNSVFHLAIMFRAPPETYRFLLDAGADKTLFNSDGQTALDIATAQNNAEIAALLGQ